MPRSLSHAAAPRKRWRGENRPSPARGRVGREAVLLEETPLIKKVVAPRSPGVDGPAGRVGIRSSARSLGLGDEGEGTVAFDERLVEAGQLGAAGFLTVGGDQFV